MRTVRGFVAASSAAFLVVGVLGAPVDANVRTFTDRRGDAPRSIDISRVRVDNSTQRRSRVTVRVTQRRLGIGDHISIYFDTKRKRRGPEFRLSAPYASEFTLVRMKSWTKHGRHSDCWPYKLRMSPSGVSRAVVARKCLGNPGRLRVAVKTGRDGPGQDWARGKRRWLGWVRR